MDSAAAELLTRFSSLNISANTEPDEPYCQPHRKLRSVDRNSVKLNKAATQDAPLNLRYVKRAEAGSIPRGESTLLVRNSNLADQELKALKKRQVSASFDFGHSFREESGEGVIGPFAQNKFRHIRSLTRKQFDSLPSPQVAFTKVKLEEKMLKSDAEGSSSAITRKRQPATINSAKFFPQDFFPMQRKSTAPCTLDTQPLRPKILRLSTLQ